MKCSVMLSEEMWYIYNEYKCGLYVYHYIDIMIYIMVCIETSSLLIYYIILLLEGIVRNNIGIILYEIIYYWKKSDWLFSSQRLSEMVKFESNTFSNKTSSWRAKGKDTRLKEALLHWFLCLFILVYILLHFYSSCVI